MEAISESDRAAVICPAASVISHRTQPYACSPCPSDGRRSYAPWPWRRSIRSATAPPPALLGNYITSGTEVLGVPTFGSFAAEGARNGNRHDGGQTTGAQAASRRALLTAAGLMAPCINDSLSRIFRPIDWTAAQFQGVHDDGDDRRFFVANRFLSRHQPNFPLGEVPSYHQEVDQRLMQRWDVHFPKCSFSEHQRQSR